MLAQINQAQQASKPNKLQIALGLLEPAISIGTKLATSSPTGKLSDYAKFSSMWDKPKLNWSIPDTYSLSAPTSNPIALKWGGM